MREIVVHLPDDLKSALKLMATQRGSSEEEIVLEAICVLVKDFQAPRPRLPLFSSGDPTLAERFDEELVGFGED